MLFNQGRARKLCGSFFFIYLFFILGAASQGHIVSAVSVRTDDAFLARLPTSSPGTHLLLQISKVNVQQKFPEPRSPTLPSSNSVWEKHQDVSKWMFLRFSFTSGLWNSRPPDGDPIFLASSSADAPSPALAAAERPNRERERASECGGLEAAKASSAFCPRDGAEAERLGGKRYSWRVSEQKR